MTNDEWRAVFGRLARIAATAADANPEVYTFPARLTELLEYEAEFGGPGEAGDNNWWVKRKGE